MSSSLPASWVLQRTSKKWLWCRACQRKVAHHQEGTHGQSPLHLAAMRKMQAVDEIALDMWQGHRGAPADEAPASAPAVSRVLAAHRRALLRAAPNAAQRRW